MKGKAGGNPANAGNLLRLMTGIVLGGIESKNVLADLLLFFNLKASIRCEKGF
jgi:hypothetical protein